MVRQLVSTQKIEIDPTEIINIGRQLEKITSELETNAMQKIYEIDATKFYLDGQALRTMNELTSANERIIEVYEHYQRAQILVLDILDEMMQKDQEIANKIFKELEE